MIKRVSALLLALVAVFSFASCDKGDDVTGSEPLITETMVETVAETTTETVSETPVTEATTLPVETATATTTEPVEVTETTAAQKDIGPLMEQYVINKISDGSYTMRFKQLGVRLITTIDGSNSVIESNASGILQITLIAKDGRYFMLVPTTKKYVEMSAEEYAEQAASFNNVSVSFEGIKLIGQGEETIMGVNYQTETYDEGERGTVTYFFTEDGLKKLRSVKDGKTNDVDTFEISSDVDLSVFEIPDGYRQVDDPGQVMLP
ncbi:MAG: hypothetical protein IJB86_02325 [Clostridia bacterium]|nr:hypothetical protein [Clostridia bacterium]